MIPRLGSLAGVLLVTLALSGCIDFDIETVKKYSAPPIKPDADLVDDKLSDKPPTPFDPEVVDRRPLNGWKVNASAAVLKLDVPAVKPDEEKDLLILHPSYTAACAAAKARHANDIILPSVNLLDGKAKQFDDGLYAALDLAYYQGLKDHLRSHVDLIQRLLALVDPKGEAAGFLMAGLELAGVRYEPSYPTIKERWRRDFDRNEYASKPAGFYTWNDDLKTCFRFLRFFQHEFTATQLAIPTELSKALQADPALRQNYSKACDFYRKLTNPSICLDLTDLESSEPFEIICASKKVAHRTVAVFPSSATRESVLFEKLFPMGLPPSANLMMELIRRIRSSEVSLAPTPNSGWYDYQVHALETMLLPEKGEENAKLLLTRAYKKRMLEAFQAMLTKRRETHLRQVSCPFALSAAMPPPLPEKISPRLRVEPCPSYYVRTARAYAFLTNFLEASVGEEGLRKLHGLSQHGPRAQDLYTELRQQRDRFYGLYLISCEDIGLKPRFLEGESIDAERCYRLASQWLLKVLDDPDLASDTRVAVPVFMDDQNKVSRHWMTLGVRMARLTSEYVRPPHLRPVKEDGDWQPVEMSRLAAAEYLIAVDEFAEVELRGLRVVTREELRAICDRAKTKAAILAALKK